jgi:glutathionylspermidine synthase
MQRHSCTPRPNWREKVEGIGLTYHSHETGPYWDESACYEFTAAEIDELERAARTLHFLCIDAAEAVIRHDWWDRLAIPPAAVPSIRNAWERDDFSLYGRFDLAYDGTSPPKLLEYNADTPTALVEAAVAQWFWLQDARPEADQFNSIHERLIGAWRRWAGRGIHFSCIRDHAEDHQTVTYLRDTCIQAGIESWLVPVEDIGWDAGRHCFVDLDHRRIDACFKLYPWEWLWREKFASHLPAEPVQFLEPAWKMLLSNKGLLPVLWELFPGHPNLLPAHETAERLGASYVAKPKLSREGANISWVEGGVVIEETEGGYGAEGRVFQALAPIPSFEGNRPVCGVWIVDHEPAGLGIREDHRRITGNLSRFVPHFFPKGDPHGL